MQIFSVLHLVAVSQAGSFKRFFAMNCTMLALLLSLSTASLAKNIATLDWTIAETLLALGQPPVAMGEVENYKIWVSEPKLPSDIVDLGIRLQPNLEQIYLLSRQHSAKKLHFINSSFYEQAREKLHQFAQVDQVDFYQAGDAWQNVVNATKQVATLIGQPERAEQLLANYAQKIAEIKPLVAPFRDRPVALVQFIDTRHLRIYAENSLFGKVLQQLGFSNAWQGKHNLWGFEVIDVTQLAKLAPGLRFVVVKPYPHNIEKALRHNRLWQHLAMAKDPLVLPAIWSFGAVPSAERFAKSFAHALQFGGEPW